MKMEPARFAAQQKGQVRYTSIIPCPRGHIGERYARTSHCCKCRSVLDAKRKEGQP